MQRIRVVLARPMVGFLPSTSHPMVMAGVLFSWTALWPGPQTTDTDSHRCAQVTYLYISAQMHIRDLPATRVLLGCQSSLALFFPISFGHEDKSHLQTGGPWTAR